LEGPSWQPQVPGFLHHPELQFELELRLVMNGIEAWQLKLQHKLLKKSEKSFACQGTVAACQQGRHTPRFN
jgi:hypothetical protein